LYFSAGVLIVQRTVIPEVAERVLVHAVPVMPNILQVRDIAVRQGIRITMMGNATSVRKGIINTARAPVTAASQVTLIITMVNVTSVLLDITNTTRAPVTAARQGTRITMMGNAIRSPRVLLQVLTPWSYTMFQWMAVPAARPRRICSVPDG